MGVAVGLMLVEGLLLREVGSPIALARTLGDLGHPWADPVASVLALMALTAEAMVGYLLLVHTLKDDLGLCERQLGTPSMLY